MGDKSFLFQGTSLCCLLPWPASPTTSRCSAWGSRWRKRSSRLYLESKVHELEVKLGKPG